MIIQHNLMALNAYNRLGNNNSMVSKNLEKLSSGYRINRAGDDASGLAVSEKMRAQITGLNRATMNAKDGISVVQTAEGALTEVHSMLNRLVELGTQSANGVYQAEDREKIQAEVNQITEEIDRISQATNFNGINLLDGTLGQNKAAFKVSETAGKAAGAVSFPETGVFPADAGPDATKIHVGKAATTEVKPSFTVDLGTFTTGAGDGTGDVKLTVNIGGLKVELTENAAPDATATLTTPTGGATGTSASLTQKVAVGSLENLSTKDVATLIANTVNAQAGTAKNADGKGAVQINGALYTVSAQDSKLSFSYAGNGLTTAPLAANITPDAAVDANAGSPTLSVTTEVDNVSSSGLVDHATSNVINPVEAGAPTLAGTDFKLGGANIVKDGYKLTIEDKTFVFKTDVNSKVKAEAGETLIDVSHISGGAVDQLNEAADLLSHYETANFKIESRVETTDAATTGVIHIAQKVDSREVFDSADKIKALFSATDAGTAGSTNIAINASDLKMGDTLRVDGQAYQFVDKASSVDMVGAKAVVISGLTRTAGSFTDNVAAAKALASAIGTDATAAGASVSIKGTADTNPTITAGGLTMQVGDTSDGFNKVTVAVDDMSSKGLGLDNLKVTEQGLSSDAIDKVKAAIEKVSVNRGSLGALQNRLEYTINNLTTTTENMTAAESRIRDTDMAKEMMAFTKNNVLVQAAQAMLAQANQQPQQVLQLLR